MALPRPTRQAHQPIEVEKRIQESLKLEDFRPSDVFRFEPKPDITPDELAYLISIFWTLDLNFDRFLSLEQDLQKHFQPVKENNK
jgi:hypothetical protein